MTLKAAFVYGTLMTKHTGNPHHLVIDDVAVAIGDSPYYALPERDCEDLKLETEPLYKDTGLVLA